jgi:S-(hydroxymethyl)glutathione dehydrogenase/alcohol dehydrogenase
MQFCNGNPPKSTFGEMDDGTYRLSQGDTPVRSFVGIGSLGEYAVVRRRKLVKFDLDAAFETMCLISCGVTTGLGAALNSGEIRPGTHVLVFGCGGVGLSIIQGARIAGAARIIAVDNNSRKLDMAANLGATDCIMSPEDPADLVAEVRKILPRGVEVAFDAGGMRTDRLQYLMAATDMGGLTLAVGVLPMTETVPVLGRDLLLGARRLAGVRGGNGFPGLDIPRILKLYAAGLLKLDEMVGPKFEFEEISPAFESAAKADFARTVVRIAPSLL